MYPGMRIQFVTWSVVAVLGLCFFISHSPAQASEAQEIYSLIKNGKLKDAKKRTTKLLKSNPDDPELRFTLAIIAEKTGNEKTAVSIYKSLTESHPEFLAPYNNLAVYHARRGDYEAAISALQQAIESQPAVAVAYRNLTAIYTRLASAAYRKALNSNEPISSLDLATLDQYDLIIPTLEQPETELVAVAQAVPNNLVSEQNNSSNTDTTVIATVIEPSETTPTPVEVVAAPAIASTQDDTKQEKVEIASNTVATDSNNSDSELTTKTIVVAAAASTAEAKQIIEDNAAQKQALINHIKSWASAWSERDVEGYLSHYSNNFSPRDNISLEEWKQQRHGRLRWRKFIEVKPSKYTINIAGDAATVNFDQYYKSDLFEDTIRKTLKFNHENGRWLITEEII